MAKDNEQLPSLSDLKRRIDAEKPHGQEAQKAPENNLGRAMSYAVELLAGLGVGGALGYGIDHLLGSFPIFFMVFFFLGFAAGFRNLIRSANKDNNENN